ncbi:uncharacterized protein LOC127261186 [Andrographis paniculata]|uniref:uncharacterized protein LOC127261186 n=1 Tax=Andrographis paniculata TaxID=175694 RepID=UPI0021E82BBB|nr:uncharacterized protein LOC127261186 [Andrographis paniculata]XP_051145493.1 uncharacterized protein LOC127261186 [Andrographis paniculata]XP_051145571.1 uncharacterized protein LOC127261186 [Andrographis paniculata]
MHRDRGASNHLGSPYDRMFGGKDPFDDPFFSRPFGSLFGSMSTSVRGSLQHSNRSKQLVIEELGSDAAEMTEGEEENDNTDAGWSNRNPLVVHPEDQDKENGKNYDSNINKISCYTNQSKGEGLQPQNNSMSFQRVTYGGVNGAYYTATTSRRTGSDGLTLEESKQADRTTGQATHRISRGIQDKGHSVTRKLDSDGKVDTVQTLHNLDEDELVGFEKDWSDRDLHGWNPFDFSRSSAGPLSAWEGFSDPFNDNDASRRKSGSSFHHSTFQNQSPRGKPKKVRINIE